MTGYTTDGWGDLFVAAAGATAALSGLIFVAISVNIGPVLEADKRTGQNFLTGRALEALVALLNVLAISLVGLTPTIPRGAFAAFILVVAAESAISPVRALGASRSQPSMDTVALLRLVTAFALTASLVVAGITLAWVTAAVSSGYPSRSWSPYSWQRSTPGFSSWRFCASR